MIFEQFTTEYEPVEDRIRLSGSTNSGDLASVWLNLRMLRLLVPALVRCLESRFAMNGPHDVALQKFQQVAALALRARGGPAARVPPVGGQLAVSVDYSDLGLAVRLTFKDQDQQNIAIVDLPDAALRQWLQILRDLHAAAQWPLDAFPSWIAPEADEPLRLN